ncbi:hypothetical protein MSHI_10000 [Mycobacterium shinjukuense]|uniref:Uncharacterized protein n=1 Tax=Mycobacterium shinjukuense TaxID=398694 RepID=A0A7I7MLE1_9MYCO|nr:hypothetical protein MSHI_10000 [Mycobacterium shinjukuense]
MSESKGVGVSNPDKVGRGVGDIRGLAPVGITATDDVDALIALKPDALVHCGPTAMHAKANISLGHALATGRRWITALELPLIPGTGTSPEQPGRPRPGRCRAHE